MNLSRSTLQRVLAGVACLFGAFILFHWYGNATRGYINTHSLFYWWGYQWFDPASETQHGPLVLLASLGLFLWNLRRASSAYPKSNDRVFVAAMFLALVLHVAAFGMQQTRLSILALLIFLWSGLGLIGGQRWSSAALFPVGFLVFAIPVEFLQPLSFYLRLGVSEATEKLFGAFGHSILRSGTQLFAPDGRFQYDVAAACSGIRSLVALTALSVFIGYVRLAGWSRRFVLLLLVIPSAFAGNLIRILFIVYFGQHFGGEVGERVHAWSGFLVFAVVLGCLLGAVRLLEPRKKFMPPDVAGAETELRKEERRTERKLQLSRVVVLVALGLGVAGWSCRGLERRAPAANAGVRIAANGIDPAPLPEFIGTEWIGQRVDVTASEKEVLPPDTGYSRKNYVSMADRNSQVFVSIVLSGRDRSSIHRPELCLAGQGWSVNDEQRRVLKLGLTQLPVTMLHVEKSLPEFHGETRKWKGILLYTFVGPQDLIASHSMMIWKSSFDRMRHLRSDRWAYLVVQTSAENGEDAALARIREVMLPIWPAIRAETGEEGREADLK